IAQLIGEAAERARKQEALLWLGKELPTWTERCPVHVRITEGGVGGATVFNLENDRVLSRTMNLEGPLDRLLSSCLPHEVTHAVLADHFRGLIPRWADEGMALMAEDAEEQQRHAQFMAKLADRSDRFISLDRLLPMNDFPKDVVPLYIE